ncbi:MAG: hypothetical protein Q9192_008801, partial [Flavoplaca navasiana]
VFAEDFGIRPYFRMDKSWYTGLEGCCDFNLTAEAYLILPVIRAPIATTSGPDVASLSIKHVVDLSLLVDLSEHQRQKLLKAAAILKLHRYNKYDDESEYVQNEKWGVANVSKEESSEDEDGRNWAELSEDVSNAIETISIASTTISSSSSSPRSQKRLGIKIKKEEIEPRLMLLGSAELKTGYFVQL